MLHTDCVPVAVLSLLRQLNDDPAMSGFYLAGGTSLALRFGHRVSVDLGFFTPEEFDPEALMENLSPIDRRVISRSPNSLTLEVGATKVDFLRHAYALLEPVQELDGIRIASIRDVVAMKLNAIVGRGAKKDYFDVSRLLEEFSLEELLACFERKYPQTERFVVLKSLVWFVDADGEPDPEVRNGKSWEEVRRGVSRAVVALGTG